MANEIPEALEKDKKTVTKASAKKTTTKKTAAKKTAAKTTAKKATAKKAAKPSSKLVIVESPAKAKTIQKYLGKGYEVMASMGHVRDLPKSRLGVDIEHDFQPEYIDIRGKGELRNQLKKAAKHSSFVYLATDPDREGEAISWHLSNMLGLDNEEKNRVTFNEITKTGIKNGMAAPRNIDINLVNAQQTRRILDRLVGYKLSPFLWKTVKPGLSAGRVQSVVVKLIVDREKEIRDFKQEEYWTIDAKLSTSRSKKQFPARLASFKGEKVEIKNEAQAKQILSELEGGRFCHHRHQKGRQEKDSGSALHHLDPAAGGFPPLRIPGKAYHEGRAGAVRRYRPAKAGRGGSDYLHAYRLAAHLRRGCAGSTGIYHRQIRGTVSARKAPRL